jgi:hypothetical protein
MGGGVIGVKSAPPSTGPREEIPGVRACSWSQFPTGATFGGTAGARWWRWQRSEKAPAAPQPPDPAKRPAEPPATTGLAQRRSRLLHRRRTVTPALQSGRKIEADAGPAVVPPRTMAEKDRRHGPVAVDNRIQADILAGFACTIAFKEMSSRGARARSRLRKCPAGVPVHNGSESKWQAGVTVHHGWKSEFPGGVPVHPGRKSKFPGGVRVHHGWD